MDCVIGCSVFIIVVGTVGNKVVCCVFRVLVGNIGMVEGCCTFWLVISEVGKTGNFCVVTTAGCDVSAPVSCSGMVLSLGEVTEFGKLLPTAEVDLPVKSWMNYLSYI